MTGDHNLFALLDPIEQSAERVFGLESANLHRDPH
jgi:hypothetical protein